MAGGGRVYVSGYFRGASRQVPGILTVDKREFDEFEERFWMCHSFDGVPEGVTVQSGPSKSLAKLRQRRCRGTSMRPPVSSRGHLKSDGTLNDTPRTALKDSENSDSLLLTHTLYNNSNRTGCRTEGTTSTKPSKAFPDGGTSTTPRSPSRQASTDQTYVPNLDGVPPTDVSHYNVIDRLVHTTGTNPTKEASNPTGLYNGCRTKGTTFTKPTDAFPQSTQRQSSILPDLEGTSATPRDPSGLASTEPLQNGQTFVDAVLPKDVSHYNKSDVTYHPVKTTGANSANGGYNPTESGYRTEGTTSMKASDPIPESTLQESSILAILEGTSATLWSPSRLTAIEPLGNSADQTCVSTGVEHYNGTNVIDHRIHTTQTNLTKGASNPLKSYIKGTTTTNPNDAFPDGTLQQSSMLQVLEGTSATPRAPSRLASTKPLGKTRDQTFGPKFDGVSPMYASQDNGTNVTIYTTSANIGFLKATIRQTRDMSPGPTHRGVYKETPPNEIYLGGTPSTNLDRNTTASNLHPDVDGMPTTPELVGTISTDAKAGCRTDAFKQTSIFDSPKIPSASLERNIITRTLIPDFNGTPTELATDPKEGYLFKHTIELYEGTPAHTGDKFEGTTSAEDLPDVYKEEAVAGLKYDEEAIVTDKNGTSTELATDTEEGYLFKQTTKLYEGTPAHTGYKFEGTTSAEDLPDVYKEEAAAGLKYDEEAIVTDKNGTPTELATDTKEGYLFKQTTELYEGTPAHTGDKFEGTTSAEDLTDVYKEEAAANFDEGAIVTDKKGQSACSSCEALKHETVDFMEESQCYVKAVQCKDDNGPFEKVTTSGVDEAYHFKQITGPFEGTPTHTSNKIEGTIVLERFTDLQARHSGIFSPKSTNSFETYAALKQTAEGIPPLSKNSVKGTATTGRDPEQSTASGNLERDTTHSGCSKNKKLMFESLFTKDPVEGTTSAYAQNCKVTLKQGIDVGRKKSIDLEECTISRQSGCSKETNPMFKGSTVEDRVEGTISTDAEDPVKGTITTNAKEKGHKVTPEQSTGFGGKENIEGGIISKQSRVGGTISDCKATLKQNIDVGGKKSIDLEGGTTSEQSGCSKYTNPMYKGSVAYVPVEGTTSTDAEEETSKVIPKQNTDFDGTSRHPGCTEDTNLMFRGIPSTPGNRECLEHESKDRVQECRPTKPPLKRKQALRSKYFEKPKRARRKDQNCNHIRTRTDGDILTSGDTIEGVYEGSLQKNARVKRKAASSPVPCGVRASARLKAQAKQSNVQSMKSKQKGNCDESKIEDSAGAEQNSSKEQEYSAELTIEECASKSRTVDSKLCATDSGYNYSFSSCTESAIIGNGNEALKHDENKKENQSVCMSREVLKQAHGCREEMLIEERQCCVKFEDSGHCEESAPNDEEVEFLGFEDEVAGGKSLEAPPLVKMDEECSEVTFEVCAPGHEKLKQEVLVNANTQGIAIKVKQETLAPDTEEPAKLVACPEFEEPLICEERSIAAGETVKVETCPGFKATLICEESPPTRFPGFPKNEETQNAKFPDDAEPKWCPPGCVKVETCPGFEATLICEESTPGTPKTEDTQDAKLPDDAEPNWCPPGSRAPLWTPPRSPHNLIEETLYHNPWGLLVATIFLNKTSSYQAGPYIFDFLERYPEPSKVLDVKPEDLEPFFTKIGLKKRAVQVWRMSHDFLHKRWRNVGELYGIGKYGEDAYRMFCLGDMEGVEPKDRFLKIYKAWYHMFEGRKKVEF